MFVFIDRRKIVLPPNELRDTVKLAIRYAGEYLEVLKQELIDDWNNNENIDVYMARAQNKTSFCFNLLGITANHAAWLDHIRLLLLER